VSGAARYLDYAMGHAGVVTGIGVTYDSQPPPAPDVNELLYTYTAYTFYAPRYTYRTVVSPLVRAV
jgi:hypothetical protein